MVNCLNLTTYQPAFSRCAPRIVEPHDEKPITTAMASPQVNEDRWQVGRDRIYLTLYTRNSRRGGDNSRSAGGRGAGVQREPRDRIFGALSRGKHETSVPQAGVAQL